MAEGGGYPNIISTLGDGNRPNPHDLLLRYSEAKQIRAPYEADWRMNAAFCLPRHYSSWQSEGPTLNAPNNQAVKRYAYDATAARALPKWSAILRRLATPDGQRWARLTASDPYLRNQYRVRIYFDALNDVLFKLRYDPEAMFSQTVDEIYLGLGCYGTAPLRMKWRRRTPIDRGGGFAYKAMPLKDCFPLANGDGKIDTMFMRFFYTAGQIKKLFPNAMLPTAVMAELNKAGGPSNTRHFEIVHVVTPREESRYNPRSLTVNRHPFIGCVIMVDEAVYIGNEEGFRSFPYLVPRTATEPGEIFGFSPAQQASPATGSVNAMKKSLLRLGQKAADPPLLASDDGVLSGKLGLTPGYVNFGAVNAQGQPLVQALQTGNFAPAEALLEDEREDINDAFLVTLFQILMETPEMTATEVIERVAEKATLAAPTMGRLQTGLLGPEVSRALDLIVENAPWMLPEMPNELIEAQGEYEVIYTSPMAKGLHAEEDSGFVWMVNTSLEVASATGDPSIMDHYNLDVAIPELADHRNVPTRWMATPEEVKMKRDSRAQAAQQQQLTDAAPSIAAIAATSQKADAAAA